MLGRNERLSTKSSIKALQNPMQSPVTSAEWTANGHVVSPLQTNDTFMLDLGNALSDRDHIGT